MDCLGWKVLQCPAQEAWSPSKFCTLSWQSWNNQDLFLWYIYPFHMAAERGALKVRNVLFVHKSCLPQLVVKGELLKGKRSKSKGILNEVWTLSYFCHWHSLHIQRLEWFSKGWATQIFWVHNCASLLEVFNAVCLPPSSPATAG